MKRLRPSGDSIGQPSFEAVFTSALDPTLSALTGAPHSEKCLAADAKPASPASTITKPVRQRARTNVRFTVSLLASRIDRNVSRGQSSSDRRNTVLSTVRTAGDDSVNGTQNSRPVAADDNRAARRSPRRARANQLLQHRCVGATWTATPLQARYQREAARRGQRRLAARSDWMNKGVFISVGGIRQGNLIREIYLVA
jgi:hypothetical protein